MTKTYFISGHLDISEDEFALHYIPKLDQVISEGSNFIVGDARGTDLFSQRYLKSKDIPPDRVTVCHMFKKPRNNPAKYPTVGGFKSDKERDTYMTSNSDEDIAYVRSVEEQKKLYGKKYKHRISGTEKNIIRRKINHK